MLYKKEVNFDVTTVCLNKNGKNLIEGILN